MYYDDDYIDGCRKCGVRDYGFDLPDTRTVLYIPEEDEDLERQTVKIKIERHWKECSFCENGMDFDVVWVVEGPDGRCWTAPSENAARKLIEAEWPEAEEDHDPAWESERWLRRAEGWE